MTSHSGNRRVAVAAMLATLCTSPGQTYLVSSFNASWYAELNVDATSLSSAYAVATLLASTLLPSAGRFSDKHGPRRAMGLAGLGLAAGCLLASRVSSLTQLAMVFVALRFFGQGALSLFGSHALALAFPRRLGTVEGLRNGAISLAVGLFPPLAVASIAGFGWRASYAGIGLITLVTVGTAVALLPSGTRDRERQRDREPPPSASATLLAAVRNARWWMLAGVVSAHAALVTAAHFHLQGLGREASLDELTASGAMGVYAVASLASTLIGGTLADRFEPLVLLALGCAALASGCVAPTLLAGGAGIYAALGAIGVAQGICGACVSPACLRAFGIDRYGALRGTLATAGVAGASLGPLLVAAAAGQLGDLRSGLAPCAILALIPAVACLASARRTLARGGPQRP